MPVQIQPKKEEVSITFFDPISLEIVIGPLVAPNCDSYKRASIQSWLDLGRKMCPKTNDMFEHSYLIPNHNLRKKIEDFLETHECMKEITKRMKKDNISYTLKHFLNFKNASISAFES